MKTKDWNQFTVRMFIYLLNSWDMTLNFFGDMVVKIICNVPQQMLFKIPGWELNGKLNGKKPGTRIPFWG